MTRRARGVGAATGAPGGAAHAASTGSTVKLDRSARSPRRRASCSTRTDTQRNAASNVHRCGACRQPVTTRTHSIQPRTHHTITRGGRSAAPRSEETQSAPCHPQLDTDARIASTRDGSRIPNGTRPRNYPPPATPVVMRPPPATGYWHRSTGCTALRRTRLRTFQRHLDAS